MGLRPMKLIEDSDTEGTPMGRPSKGLYPLITYKTWKT